MHTHSNLSNLCYFIQFLFLNAASHLYKLTASHKNN